MSTQASRLQAAPLPPGDTQTLATASRLPDPDRAFRLLIEARRGLTLAQAAALDARLVLLLANHIGDETVLREAIAAATACLPE